MTPEEKQKADAWMLLKDSDAVRTRILDVVQAAFDQREVMSWIAGKLIDAEKNSMRAPLKAYFEDQLQRNLRMILEEGVRDQLVSILRPMVDQAVADHADRVDIALKELKKLKSKGPIHGKR